MKLESISLSNFRCFGSAGVSFDLNDLTTLIGSNGAGKTAILQALVRLFGISAAQRSIQKSDFYLRPFSKDELEPNISLRIEVVLRFPELTDKTAATQAIPECFRHMSVTEESAAPTCRIRLEATWTQGNLPEGEVVEARCWVRPKPDGTEEITPLQPHERSRIHVHYVPASRDPAGQLRHTAGTMLHRLFRAMEWSGTTEQSIADAFQSIRNAFQAESGIKAFETQVASNWSDLHDGPLYANPRLQPVASTLDQVLKQVSVAFSPAEDGSDLDIERLSEGLRSLFYIALVSCVFDLEQKATASASEPGASEATDTAPSEEQQETCPFLIEKLAAPALAIFAIEEPENHLSPHFLGRVVATLTRISTHANAQVVLSSHSPAILARVQPEDVRYVRLDLQSHTADVRAITLPSETEAAHKYVREAVRAYPELYFARAVVFGEGDSEEIVIPRFAEAHGIPIDRNLASVVPLGGRHVSHFWRLLTDLNIPYITLLDFDLERYGGGWGRIKYALKQLLALGIDTSKLLTIPATETEPEVSLSVADLEALHKRADDLDSMRRWVLHLEQFDVFYSALLDLDWSMLSAFPSAYQSIGLEPDGTQFPSIPPEKRDERIASARRAVLGESGGEGKTYEKGELFPWYRFLFLTHSKPATHLIALAGITDEDLRKSGPGVLNRVVDRLKQKLASA